MEVPASDNNLTTQKTTRRQNRCIPPSELGVAFALASKLLDSAESKRARRERRSEHDTGWSSRTRSAQAPGDLQPVCFHQRGIGQHWPGRAIGNDLAVIEHEDTLTGL